MLTKVIKHFAPTAERSQCLVFLAVFFWREWKLPRLGNRPQKDSNELAGGGAHFIGYLVSALEQGLLYAAPKHFCHISIVPHRQSFASLHSRTLQHRSKARSE